MKIIWLNTRQLQFLIKLEDYKQLRLANNIESGIVDPTRSRLYIKHRRCMKHLEWWSNLPCVLHKRYPQKYSTGSAVTCIQVWGFIVHMLFLTSSEGAASNTPPSRSTWSPISRHKQLSIRPEVWRHVPTFYSVLRSTVTRFRYLGIRWLPGLITVRWRFEDDSGKSMETRW